MIQGDDLENGRKRALIIRMVGEGRLARLLRMERRGHIRMDAG
jgi:hypothetical protein